MISDMGKALPRVQLDNFEGPYDLLLELAQKRKLDLSEVSLRHITDDFLGYIKEKRISAGLQGDFLVVASTLLLLKVRRLLPSITIEEEEEVEGFEDRVRIYQLYRQKSEFLIQNWGMHLLLPSHFWAEGERENENEGEFPEVSGVDLSRVMKRIVKRLPDPVTPKAHMKVNHGKSLGDILLHFKARLKKVQQVVLQEYMKGTSRQEAAVSFLAVLEMARDDKVELHQEKAFESLVIKKT